MQGCALAEHVGPWGLTFATGNKKISDFSYKSYAGHHRFYSFRALGSLQFSLEHSLEMESALIRFSEKKNIVFVTLGAKDSVIVTSWS